MSGRNIVNIEEVEKFILGLQSLPQCLTNEAVKSWLGSTFRRWVINQSEYVSKCTIEMQKNRLLASLITRANKAALPDTIIVPQSDREDYGFEALQRMERCGIPLPSQAWIQQYGSPVKRPDHKIRTRLHKRFLKVKGDLYYFDMSATGYSPAIDLFSSLEEGGIRRGELIMLSSRSGLNIHSHLSGSSDLSHWLDFLLAMPPEQRLCLTVPQLIEKVRVADNGRYVTSPIGRNRNMQMEVGRTTGMSISLGAPYSGQSASFEELERRISERINNAMNIPEELLRSVDYIDLMPATPPRPQPISEAETLRLETIYRELREFSRTLGVVRTSNDVDNRPAPLEPESIIPLPFHLSRMYDYEVTSHPSNETPEEIEKRTKEANIREQVRVVEWLDPNMEEREDFIANRLLRRNLSYAQPDVGFIEHLCFIGEFKGCTLVKLDAQESYDSEGYRMAHCVADYFVRKSFSDVYSFRNSRNTSIMTVEISKGRIVQIQGFRNFTPPATLRRLIRDTLGFGLLSDKPAGFAAGEMVDFLYRSENRSGFADRYLNANNLQASGRILRQPRELHLNLEYSPSFAERTLRAYAELLGVPPANPAEVQMERLQREALAGGFFIADEHHGITSTPHRNTLILDSMTQLRDYQIINSRAPEVQVSEDLKSLMDQMEKLSEKPNSLSNRRLKEALRKKQLPLALMAHQHKKHKEVLTDTLLSIATSSHVVGAVRQLQGPPKLAKKPTVHASVYAPLLPHQQAIMDRLYSATPERVVTMQGQRAGKTTLINEMYPTLAFMQASHTIRVHKSRGRTWDSVSKHP